MAQLQEIFNRIQETKQQIKDLKDAYKDALANSHEYQKIDEEMKALRARKKDVELSIREDFGGDFDKMDELKLDMDNDKELLSDLAMSLLMKGETVEVMDGKEIPYEPVFKVSFKRQR